MSIPSSLPAQHQSSPSSSDDELDIPFDPEQAKQCTKLKFDQSVDRTAPFAKEAIESAGKLAIDAGATSLKGSLHSSLAHQSPSLATSASPLIGSIVNPIAEQAKTRLPTIVGSSVDSIADSTKHTAHKVIDSSY